MIFHGLKYISWNHSLLLLRLQVMFPDMDAEVIEAVLRANNGAVDATIVSSAFVVPFSQPCAGPAGAQIQTPPALSAAKHALRSGHARCAHLRLLDHTRHPARCAQTRYN